MKNIEIMSYNMVWSFPKLELTITNLFSLKLEIQQNLPVTLPVGNYSDEVVVEDLASAMSKCWFANL